MFTPIKGYGVFSDTILNTPQPQASSTVRRKSPLESKFSNKPCKDEQNVPHEKELAQKEQDSSLGLLCDMSILTNMSVTGNEQKNSTNMDAQLEYARRLLQKCSDTKSSLTIDTNKENNANVQNITGNLSVSNFILSNESDQECNINRLTNEVGETNVTFDPNEITARSSECQMNVNNSAKKQFLLSKSFNGMSFSTDEIMAQVNNDIMKQLNNEDFLSGSKIDEQLSIDEALWQQDRTYGMPGMSTNKQELDLTSFSGIIGQLDLTVESCAGQKLSIGQYFERKSADIGILGNDKQVRQNFDFTLESPKRNNLEPLVESTILPNATATLSTESKEEHTFIANATRNMNKDNIISLSTILDTLQNVDSGTPRRLVDQILMVQKKKKNSLIMQNNAIQKTYVLPSDRKSMLATPTGNFSKFDENILENLSVKLSLDSKTKDIIKSETIKDETVNVKQERSRVLSFASNENTNAVESFTNISKGKMLKEEASDKSATSLFNQDAGNVVIGKNTEQLCNCIIGMTNEVNIELLNHGDRWITYSLKLNEVLGDMQSIEFNIPQDEILLKPNGAQSTKIKVKVIQMCKQIFVALNIILIDMVTKSKWCMKHMICVNPEQLELEIICDSHKEELDFQHITKNSTKSLPIIFHNKNSIDVPIKLSILHDGPKMFSIDDIFDKSVELHESHDELNLILKSHEKFTANIKCKQSTEIDSPQKQLQYWKSKLIIHVQCKDNTILLQKEVPLYAQMGICKIQLVDTELPIIVSRQQGKLLNIVNSGNVATHVSATIVPVEEYPNAAQNFTVEPDNMFLQVGERSSFLIVYKPQVTNSLDNERCAKIKLIAGNNVYLYIVNIEQILELEKENYLRCHTPSNAVSLSPATSPQSVTSSGSGLCDRNSPISTVSGVTVTGNTIPIKSTHAALIWNSVKTGKSDIKEFTIRNTSNNKIKIQIDIWDDNKSFKFLGDRQTVSTSIVLAMHRQELKTLAVSFSPYHIGPVTGKITIKHYTRNGSDSQQHKKIPLYGYGGYSKIKISNIFKDANGKMGLLSLGTLYSETTVLTKEIILQNIGDLQLFAKIKIIPKDISVTMYSNWHVKPKELILNPKETQRVLIEFYPKKEDFAKLQCSEVSHVATVNVMYGDEPTRWRIRRLYNKIKESDNSTENENDVLKNIVHSICKTFPGEQLASGLLSIRDSIQNLNDLCTGVHQYEIMLTVEACTDDTLPVHCDADESQLFYTLSDTTQIDSGDGASFYASQTMADYDTRRPRSSGEQFTVTPSTIILHPPVENEATVTILSLFKAAEAFQTSLSNSTYFSVVPTEGMLPSRRSFPLKIQCSQRIEHNMQAILEIYTENNKQDVLIKAIRRP
ncbi:uncharacterized protein LOC126849059 isoform X2 [Cataglyphis hispanica]|uniref:uncharacterized protein LOC126849059 isoform X2 n=1 Tax=Cataglyphis hispanica TaxID=1086592 RepID=UPI0021808598|nr:uncharacterized protein LOC126849059 isoform X2 [Cataglyphis hispanica]